MKKAFCILMLFSPLVYCEMVDLKSGVTVPNPETLVAAGFVFASTIIDADEEKYGVIFKTKNTISVRNIGFLTGTITTGDTLELRIETVNTTNGFPSGSLVCSQSSATITIASADDNIWKETPDLTSDCAILGGTNISVLATRKSGSTFNGAITRITSSNLFPYFVSSNTTSGYVKASGTPVLALKLTNGSYAELYRVIPSSSFASPSIDSTSNQQIGNVFNLPFSARVTGFYCNGNIGVNTRDFLIKLYDFNGATVIATSTVDANIVQSLDGNAFFPLDGDPVVLRPNQNYRAVFQPLATGGNVFRFYGVANSSIAAIQEWGTRIYYSSSTLTPTSPSSWTNVITQRFDLSLVIDGIDVTPGQNILYDSTIYDAVIQ